jgi:membrane-associated protease RseP (regulator of RpoE activity)
MLNVVLLVMETGRFEMASRYLVSFESFGIGF